VLLSQGTPMLAGGDEIGHTQRGNNNPYCQDNAVTWIDWSRADEGLARYTARLAALRRQWLPMRPSWYTGLPDARGQQDLSWLRRGGEALTDWDWTQAESRVLGACIGAPGRGHRPLLLLFNAEPQDTPFALPAGGWQVLLDSADEGPADPSAPPGAPVLRSHCLLRSRSVVLLVAQADPAPPLSTRSGA
jgi:glycogen operon protein